MTGTRSSNVVRRFVAIELSTSASDPPPETWLDLEKLAERIYAELAPDCKVEHDASIIGSLSEVPRQIDVLIENATLGTRVVVDCKDRTRRVSVIDAGAFASLLEDVEATSGVLICNRGFSKATTTYAKKKGFSLARLHDVESRRWNLDVLIPIIWMRLRLVDLNFGMRIRAEAGDEFSAAGAPKLLKDGKSVDVASFFAERWTAGELHLGTPGEGELSTTLDFETADGNVRPDAGVTFQFRVGGDARLGYVTPQQARGIFDEETKSFATVHFDAGETVKQEPEGGWTPVFDPHDLAIRLAGTVVTLEETLGVTGVELTGITSIQGVEPHNRKHRWTPSSGWSGPPGGDRGA